jgi:hypothetical protein
LLNSNSKTVSTSKATSTPESYAHKSSKSESRNNSTKASSNAKNNAVLKAESTSLRNMTTLRTPQFQIPIVQKSTNSYEQKSLLVTDVVDDL